MTAPDAPPPCRSCAAPFTLIATVPHDTWECRHEIGCPTGDALGGATKASTPELALRPDESKSPFVGYGLGPLSFPYSPDPPSRSFNGRGDA